MYTFYENGYFYYYMELYMKVIKICLERDKYRAPHNKVQLNIFRITTNKNKNNYKNKIK